MAKVSIIIPIYNSEAYLRDCVDSILAQSFREFELILVDDGSPDGCGTIIDEYAAGDDRIRAVHQKNGGPSSARNAGLDIATADYVYIPDSDDCMAPDLLEKAVSKMEQGYDMVVFGFKIIPDPTEAEKKNLAYDVREETELVLNSDIERFEFIAGPFRRRSIRWEVWNRMFRRDIVEKWNIRFGDDRHVYAEDMYFTYFYMAHASRILLLPDKLYTYRRHEGSGSTEYKKHLMIYSSNRMTEAYYEHCRDCGDCQYLYEHFLPIYYLLHKGAIRRLRLHQWKNGLSMEKAREILQKNIIDYPQFVQNMKAAYNDHLVRESYRKDRGGAVLQLTDRLYTGELLDIPASKLKTTARKKLLDYLYNKETRRNAK